MSVGSLDPQKARGKVITIIGNRGMGKTTLIKNLISFLKDNLQPTEPEQYYNHTLPIPMLIHGPKTSVVEYHGFPVKKSYVDFQGNKFDYIVSKYKHAFVVIEDIPGLYKRAENKDDFLTMMLNFLALPRKEDRLNTFILVSQTYQSLLSDGFNIWSMSDAFIFFRNQISASKIPYIFHIRKWEEMNEVLWNLPPYHYIFVDYDKKTMTPTPIPNSDISPIINFLYDIPQTLYPITEILGLIEPKRPERKRKSNLLDKIKEFYIQNPNASIADLVQHLNISPTTAYTYTSILRKQNLIRSKRDLIIEELNKGTSIQDILQKYDISEQTLRRMLSSATPQPNQSFQVQ
jgi:energy-coupling factor transporter ATP-binding protein EcfA2